MKFLADTCIWSLALRRKRAAALSAQEQRMVALLREAIRDFRVAMVGPIRQEILSGIRDTAQFEKTRELLEPFLDEPISAADYVEAARLFNLCRDRGVECGPVDMQICAVAARTGWPIVTSDAGLLRCIEALESAGALRRAAH